MWAAGLVAYGGKKSIIGKWCGMVWCVVAGLVAYGGKKSIIGE